MLNSHPWLVAPLMGNVAIITFFFEKVLEWRAREATTFHKAIFVSQYLFFLQVAGKKKKKNSQLYLTLPQMRVRLG